VQPTELAWDPRRERQQVIRVWDPLVRVFHWALAAGVLAASITGWRHRAMGLHEAAGYGIAGLLLVRASWGVWGSHYARFRNFPVKPRLVLRYLAELVRGRAARYLGHSPAASAMALGLLLAVLLVAGSGVLAAGVIDLDGPFAFLFPLFSDRAALAVRHVHDWAPAVLLGMVMLHVLGVIVSSRQHGENLIRAMVTGDKPLATRRHGAAPVDASGDASGDTPGPAARP
jgi:cytochrome b